MEGLGGCFTEDAFVVLQVFGGEAAKDYLSNRRCGTQACTNSIDGHFGGQRNGIAIDACADAWKGKGGGSLFSPDLY